MQLKDVIEKKKGTKSLREFASEIGVSHETVRNALNGVGKPSYKLLKALKLVKV